MSNDHNKPIEKRSHYYYNIDLGKDVPTQIHLITQATRALLISRATASDPIVVSRERILDGLDYLSSSIEEVQAGLKGLKSAFEFCISEVVWQIEKNQPILRHIIKMSKFNLSKPDKLRRKNAEIYYMHGFIDAAEEELLFSEELDDHDFTIYVSLGMIYMFRKIDLDEAIYCFENAIEYAKQKSTYYASYALMYKARILRELEFIDEAKRSLEEAIYLAPDCYELSYQLSIIEAQSNKEKALTLIVKLLDVDIRYSLKIENEPAFNVIKPELHNVYKEMIDVKSIKIKHQYDSTISELNKVAEQITKCNVIMENNEVFRPEESTLHKLTKRIIELIDRKSLLDIYTAELIVRDEIPKVFQALKDDAIHYIESSIKYMENEKIRIDSAYVRNRKKYFLYSVSGGIKSSIIYLVIYAATLFAFESRALAIVLAIIPFAIVSYLNYANSANRLSLIQSMDDKLNELFVIRNTM